MTERVDHVGLKEKTCITCGECKPADDFWLVRSSVNGRYYRQSKCKPCDNARRQKDYAKNRSRERWRAIHKKYGITRDEWEALFERQGNRCAVCKATEPGWERNWAVDHCHTTKEVRGITCVNCNLVVGHAQDDPEVLEAAAVYLRRFYADHKA